MASAERTNAPDGQQGRRNKSARDRKVMRSARKQTSSRLSSKAGRWLAELSDLVADSEVRILGRVKRCTIGPRRRDSLTVKPSPKKAGRGRR